MKGLLIGVVVVLVLILLGWIAFRSDDSNASITIDTQKIEEDTEKAVEAVHDVAEGTADASKDVLENHRRDDPADAKPVREPEPEPDFARPQP